MTDEIAAAYDAQAKNGYRGSFALFREAWLAATEHAAKVCDKQAKIYFDVAGGDLCTAAGKAIHRSMAAGAENCASTLREAISASAGGFAANSQQERQTYKVTSVSVDMSQDPPVFGIRFTEPVDPGTDPTFADCKSPQDVEFVYEASRNYPDGGGTPVSAGERIKVLSVTFGEKKTAG